MKIALSWLYDYLKTSQTAQELAQVLTRAGIEVKSISSLGVRVSHVRVAQICSSEKHPNADRLSVCQVDDGSGKTHQIVCGAKNYHPGDKVFLALPGAILPGGINIQVSQLRGVQSEGMMCSAQELGLEEESAGLYILPSQTPLGMELNTLLPEETILELEVTPNRPDWLGHLGIAREAAAFGAGDFHWKEEVLPPMKRDHSLFSIESLEQCSFYSLRSLHNISVKKSPLLLERRLQAVGLRGVNNIVDCTNYVMMETAHPLHAFDADKIKGTLSIRFAHEGEKLRALDGKTYTLRDVDLIIADQHGPQALAGIIGGAASSVTETTKSIFIESAVFNPSTLQASARFHHLHTEALYRFERGTQAHSALEASARVSSLILSESEAEAVEEIFVAGSLPEKRILPLRFHRVRKQLGITLCNEGISSLLKKLGLLPSPEGWEVPPWRLDLTREVDLMEEIVRLHGLESIQASHRSFTLPSTPADHAYDAAMLLRRRLLAAGLQEVKTPILCSAPPTNQNALLLRNPMGEEHACLRTSLIPGLLEVAKRNLYQKENSVSIFEIGKIFQSLPKNSLDHEESLSLGILMTGQQVPLSWRRREERSFDLYDLKGIFEHLVPGKISFSSSKTLFPSYALALDFFCDSKRCGYLAYLTPSEARELMLTGQEYSVIVAEVALSSLCKTMRDHSWQKIIPLSKFPSITRDFSLVLNKEITYDLIEQELLAAREPLLKKWMPLDTFTDVKGEKVPLGKKSLTLQFTFHHDDRTLRAQEVQPVCEHLLLRLKKTLGIEIRS